MAGDKGQLRRWWEATEGVRFIFVVVAVTVVYAVWLVQR